MLTVASMLLACSEAAKIGSKADEGEADREELLSNSVIKAFAFNMNPPRLMNTTLPKGANGQECPSPGVKLTNETSGGAFLDGCYYNTTRGESRNETTGVEAKDYLYMWKHSCAFTKWVPSNQFMYTGLDYDENTMTLERFGFIGMDKRCFWGNIGVLWKRPLPVEQILPNATLSDDTVTPVPPAPEP